MNAFMYFVTKIHTAIGFEDQNQLFTMICLVNMFATLPTIALLDRVGRRTLLLWSSTGMLLSCVAMGVTGIVFAKADQLSEGFVVSNSASQWVIAFSIFFFIANFAYGWGPVVWVYCSEIFPLRYRSRCHGVTTMANMLMNTVVGQFTPALVESLGFSIFFVFGFFCLMNMLMSYWLPETKGVPLEFTQQLFDGKLGFRHSTNEVQKDAVQV